MFEDTQPSAARKLWNEDKLNRSRTIYAYCCKLLFATCPMMYKFVLKRTMLKIVKHINRKHKSIFCTISAVFAHLEYHFHSVGTVCSFDEHKIGDSKWLTKLIIPCTVCALWVLKRFLTADISKEFVSCLFFYGITKIFRNLFLKLDS